MNKSLLNLPEYYCFRTNKESTEKVFRHSDRTTIEFKELEFIPQMGIVHSLSLSDREISVLVGEKDKKRSKGKTHTGTITITDENVFLEIAYDQKQFDQLLSYIDKNGKFQLNFSKLLRSYLERSQKSKITNCLYFSKF